jgi:hypothetical protein
LQALLAISTSSIGLFSSQIGVMPFFVFNMQHRSQAISYCSTSNLGRHERIPLKFCTWHFKSLPFEVTFH